MPRSSGACGAKSSLGEVERIRYMMIDRFSGVRAGAGLMAGRERACPSERHTRLPGFVGGGRLANAKSMRCVKDGSRNSSVRSRLHRLAALLFVAVLCVFAAPTESSAQQEGDLRLRANAPDDPSNKGRVEIYHDGEWGGVCDDFWGRQDADVACRQLGYSRGASGHRGRLYGPSGMKLWLVNMHCSGEESSLVDCPSAGWGPHNPHRCANGEFAGVTCKPNNRIVLISHRSLTVGEQSTATYEVWLDSQPSGSVTVDIDGHGTAVVTVSPASLTFTTTNWSTRQTVTVSPADDDDNVDDEVILTHSPAGGGYANASTGEVVVTVKDDDVPGAVIDARLLTIDEGDTTGASYGVRLTGRPSGSVTVTIAGTSGSEVSTSPTSLTFTTSNWSTEQTVTVTAAADSDALSDSVTLTHNASGGGYGSYSFPSVEVRVQDKDIEVAASPSRVNVDEDGTATYKLRTVGGPWDSLKVEVQAPVGAGFTFSPSEVTFTRSDWDSLKTIEVVGQEDDDWNNETFSITHSASGSGTGTVPVENVAVTVVDLGPPGPWVDNGGTISLTEGESATYQIGLNRDPEGVARVSVSSSSPSNLSVSPASLTFNSSNWNQARTVTIRAGHDNDSADETARVNHTLTQGGRTAPTASSLVRITDDEDGESLIGSRPADANLWWAALTVGSEPGGTLGHIDYTEETPDTGKLSDATFTYDGVGRKIDAAYLNSAGHFQIWVDSGNGAALPDHLVLHVGGASMTLGSATRQSFGTTYEGGKIPMVRSHTYWWQSGSHGVAFSNRQAVAVWLESPDPRLSVSDDEATEGIDAALEFEVTLSPAATTRVTVDYATVSGTASALSDYTPVSGTLTFEAGETLKTVSVPIVDDTVEDSGETMTLTLSNATGGAVIEDGEGLGTIHNTESVETLTAEFQDVPSEHDGSNVFDLRVVFSEDLVSAEGGPGTGGRARIMGSLTVVGGSLEEVRNTSSPARDDYTISVTPSGDGPVTLTLAAPADCEDADAVCAPGGGALSRAVSVTVQGPPDTPLTAEFKDVPAEHDGSNVFDLRVVFSEDLVSAEGGPGTGGRARIMRSLTVNGGNLEDVRNTSSPARDDYRIRVTPSGSGAVALTLAAPADCADADAVCAPGGRALSRAVSATVRGPPGLSVADATVDEAAGAELAFAITLDRAPSGSVTVDYATSDGTATAGEDYTAASGTLSFAAGETLKTVSVSVLDDSHDDDGETLTLTLSNPSGAHLADGEAVGTIRNTDPMPHAWLARFGRTVADQVIDAVQARMEAAGEPGTAVTVAGLRLGGRADAEVLEALDARGAGMRPGAPTDWFAGEGEAASGRWVSHGAGAPTARDLLMGSSFSLALGTAESGIGALWGRGAVTRFDGREGEFALDGEVASQMLGLDYTRGRGTLGVVLSHSRGSGGYRSSAGGGEVESTLTGAYPWGRFELNDQLSAWGVVGQGTGALTLTPEGTDPIKTDLDLSMAAAGLRGTVVAAPSAGGPELAVKTDAMAVRTSSEAATGSGGGVLAASMADVTRLRLGLEGFWRGAKLGAGILEPRLEIGVRHDGGDAETGFGIDLGSGLVWWNPALGIRAEVSGRGLLTHESAGFRQRGFSGSLAWDPRPDSGRGPRLTVSQTLGLAASGGVEALLNRRTLAGLAAGGDGDDLGHRRLDVRMGYGLGVIGDRFTWMPEVGLGLTHAGRELTLGWRLTPDGRQGAIGGSLEFGFEARYQQSANPVSVAGAGLVPENSVGFRVAGRW